MTRSTPSVRASSASTAAASHPGLRCSSSCTVRVTSTVPSPSTCSPPPSLTIGEEITRAPALAATVSAMRASRLQLAHSCAPQPLNTQSIAHRRPRSSITNVGPMSRIHASSSGAWSTSTAGPRCRAASAAAAGSTTIVTGSKAATAPATAAHVARASSASCASSPSV